MELVDVAYIAGFFDGEGYAGVGFRKSSKNGKRYPRIRASISQQDIRVLQWIASSVGVGQVYSDKKLYGRTRKIMHRYVVQSRRAENFLRLILPFLRVKKAQVEQALSTIAETKVQRPQGHREHGTTTMYWRGCRCEACTAANRRRASDCRRAKRAPS